jgi:hypothetical protein
MLIAFKSIDFTEAHTISVTWAYTKTDFRGPNMTPLSIGRSSI